MLAVIPSPIRTLPERWRSRVASRRELTANDPAADALELAARELETALQVAEEASRTLSTAEFARIAHVLEATVRKWCARGLLPGATHDESGRWRIPADARRTRKAS